MDHIGADRLRRGRVSIPHARYFITMVTQNRRHGLTENTVSDALVDAWRVSQADGDIDLLCATIMPNHCHLLYRLGARLRLDRVQAKLKSITSESLDAYGLEWQPNFFDHRLRENVEAEQFARYIYLNPYAKGLLSLNGIWPHWILSRKYCPEFIEHLACGVAPPKEWLLNYRNASQLIDDEMDD